MSGAHDIYTGFQLRPWFVWETERFYKTWDRWVVEKG